MKNTGLLLTFLVISIVGYSQKRVNVPGTKVWMMPPEGSRTVINPAGFRVNENTVILIITSKGNFYTQNKSFKDTYSQLPGVKIFDYKEFKVSGYPAKLILMQSNPKKKAYQLVFGDSTFSVTVIGSYDANNEKLGEKIKKSILSIQYKKDEKINHYQNMPFSLDDSQTRLKFLVQDDKFLIYSLQGKMPDKSQPKLLVALLPDKQQKTPQKLIADMLKDQESKGNDIKIIKKTTRVINGYQSYKVITTGKKGVGKEEYVFMQVITNGNYRVLFIGGMQVEGKFDPKIFTELTNTIRFK